MAKPAIVLVHGFWGGATAQARRAEPTYYQVSTEDRMIHPDNERRMAARRNPRKTVELAASHVTVCPLTLRAPPPECGGRTEGGA